MVQIIRETENIWEYKVGINAIIANCVCLWKCQLSNLHIVSSHSGTAIGTLITETGGKSNGLDIANGVLQAISSGTFIYVTFFEILQSEISHDNASIDKLLSVLLGFGVVAGLSAIPEPLMSITTICEPYILTSPPTLTDPPT